MLVYVRVCVCVVHQMEEKNGVERKEEKKITNEIIFFHKAHNTNIRNILKKAR